MMILLDGPVNEIYFKLSAPFDRLTTARLGTRLMRDGMQSPGRLDGIKATHSDLTGQQNVWVWRVTVRPAGGEPFEATFQQNLDTERRRLHLGCELLLRHDARGRRVADRLARDARPLGSARASSTGPTTGVRCC